MKKGKYNYNNNKSVKEVNKNIFKKINSRSFDYAVLEKSKNVNAIKLNIPWSDLGSWKEISNIFLVKKYMHTYHAL